MEQTTRLAFSRLRELVRREFEKKLEMPKTLNYYLYGKTGHIKKDCLNTYKVAHLKEDRVDRIGELDLNDVEYDSYPLSEEESNDDNSGKV
jgi:hypothetical protein